LGGIEKLWANGPDVQSPLLLPRFGLLASEQVVPRATVPVTVRLVVLSLLSVVGDEASDADGGAGGTV